MEIRVGSRVFPGFYPIVTPRTPPKRPSKQPPAKVLSSLRFSRNSLAKHAVRRCRMLSRVLSRLATSPFQSSFRIAPSSPLPPRRRIVRDVSANDDSRECRSSQRKSARTFAIREIRVLDATVLYPDFLLE